MNCKECEDGYIRKRDTDKNDSTPNPDLCLKSIEGCLNYSDV